MLHNQKGVALVAKAFEDFYEATGITRMEAHTGFIQYKKGINERSSEARREVNSLDFASRERAGGAVEREVAEADAAEVGHAGGDLFVDELGGGVGVAGATPVAVRGVAGRVTKALGTRPSSFTSATCTSALRPGRCTVGLVTIKPLEPGKFTSRSMSSDRKSGV